MYIKYTCPQSPATASSSSHVTIKRYPLLTIITAAPISVTRVFKSAHLKELLLYLFLIHKHLIDCLYSFLFFIPSFTINQVIRQWNLKISNILSIFTTHFTPRSINLSSLFFYLFLLLIFFFLELEKGGGRLISLHFITIKLNN